MKPASPKYENLIKKKIKKERNYRPGPLTKKDAKTHNELSASHVQKYKERILYQDEADSLQV